MTFSRTFHVSWGYMDFNAHMRNTAYLDLAGDVRMMYFAEHGFPMTEFERLRFGPVILRDELDYARELKLLERVHVDLVVVGRSADGMRWRLRNSFTRDDGKLAARVTSHGGWLDLGARKLAPPPEPLREVMDGIPRSEDYAPLT
jgi:acyl-CoA thioester hydrolase